jgi:DNA mismatch endonuclease (patch repair protein)
MTDSVSAAKRSEIMGRIRGSNTRPELIVRRYLHSQGLRFRLHDRSLPGKPDLVLRRLRAVVFVNGCFWHSHDGCKFAYRPSSNAEFWTRKFAETKARDRAAIDALRSLGWTPIVAWECQLTLAGLQHLEYEIRSARAQG